MNLDKYQDEHPLIPSDETILKAVESLQQIGNSNTADGTITDWVLIGSKVQKLGPKTVEMVGFFSEEKTLGRSVAVR